MKEDKKATGNDNAALVDLQTRLAFQDQAITELNDVITDQQTQIDRLQLQLSMLDDKLKSLEDSVDTPQGNPDDERPPHY